MDFLQVLQEANRLRDIDMTQNKSGIFSLSFRGNELAGEIGEACNIIKKLERERLNIVGSRATKDQLFEELSDGIICISLISMDFGEDITPFIARKFNKTSSERNLRTFIVRDNGKWIINHRGQFIYY